MTSIFILASLFFGIALAGTMTFDPSSSNQAEKHHSLHKPLDKSSVYWNFGGSTVLTKNFIRLTPATQDRRGWIWNDYPLESKSWEVEFKLEIHSKPNFGGDGFAFWVLPGSQDPAFSSSPEALTGPIFGMKSDFQGFGVCVDVYDNDNRRNNPTVFVLANNNPLNPTAWNHDNDFTDDMYREAPSMEQQQQFASSPSLAADTPSYRNQPAVSSKHQFKCTADLRNTGKVAKFLVKFLHKVLHVYIDVADGMGYKYCLAVQFDRTFEEHHLAFTAATGQVADMHDLLEITTRYLSEAERDINDDALPHLLSGSRLSSLRFYANILVFCLGLALTFRYGLQSSQYQAQSSQQIDLVKICDPMNKTVKYDFYLLWTIVGCLCVLGYWVLLLFHIPFGVWAIWSLHSNTYMYSHIKARNLGPARFGMNNIVTAFPRLLVFFAFHATMQILFLYYFFLSDE